MDYSIGDLVREFQTTPRTLRFYEARGLLHPRREGLTRIYSDRDRVRLTLAMRGRRIGLSLEEIKEIIEMHDPKHPDDARQSLRLLQKIHEHRQHLINKIKDIEDVLKEMHDVEARVLASLAKRGGGRTSQLPLELN